MDTLEIIRLVGAVTTVIGAFMVAVNISARITVIGFGVFILASIAWMVDGWLEGKASLLIQNAALLLINIAGVYRWLPRAKADS
jgi:ABC-type multidrug transport system fused ATPase/permease subunit